MYSKFIKRLLDFIISSILFLITLPLFIIITLLLLYTNNGKPFFFQKRPGKNEKIFKVIKFKTMTDVKDADGVLLPDVDRLTRFGTFVRKSSIDELPQLINVLKGDMSLIGPRPLLIEYLPLYNTQQKRRHNVRPGITGWSQVNGRNLALFSKRFEYDVWYVDNVSFILDIKIFLLTIIKVLFSDGVIPGQDVMDVDDLGFNKK